MRSKVIICGFKATQAMHDAIERISKAKEVSMSEVLREAAQSFIDYIIDFVEIKEKAARGLESCASGADREE